MNKKTTILIVVITVVLLVIGGICILLNNKVDTEDWIVPTTTTQTQESWKEYRNQELEFSIKYPPQYAIEASPLPTSDEWASTDFISIFDPKDTSKYEFHVIPAHIVLQRQPVTDQGKVYRTISDYVRSGEFMESGALNPEGEIERINGEEVVHYKFPQGDAEDAPIDTYYFIKNDLIYQVFLNANDPYREQILQNISFF